MADAGIDDISMLLGHPGSLLIHQLSQASLTHEQQGAQQRPQQQPIVRSPTSTLAEEDSTMKTDAATLAAMYRARIALAAASPGPAMPQAAGQPRGTPAARLLTFVNSPLPTPTVHASDQNTVQVLEKKWKTLYGGLRSNSQAAADVLMRQAQATSQLEELVQLLFIQLKANVEERVRLQQQLLSERSHLMVAAEEAAQLQQRLHTTEHRSTAVQVVTETLQSQLSSARGALESSTRERQQLADQVKQLTEQLSVTTECRTRGDALISEQAAVIEALRQQLQDQAASSSSLAEDKAALEAQLQGVLRAEQELTVHLRETHAAIEGQLAALRDQLKTERQKRAAVVKRRGELAAQVEALQGQVAAQQAEMAALAERLSRSGGASTTSHPQHHQPHPASSRPAQTGHPSTAAAGPASKPSGHHHHPLHPGGGSAVGNTSRSTTPQAAAHAAHTRPTTAAAPFPHGPGHGTAAAAGPGGTSQQQRDRSRGPVRSTHHARPTSSSSPTTSGGRAGSAGGGSGGGALAGPATGAGRRSVTPTPRSLPHTQPQPQQQGRLQPAAAAAAGQPLVPAEAVAAADPSGWGGSEDEVDPGTASTPLGPTTGPRNAPVAVMLHVPSSLQPSPEPSFSAPGAGDTAAAGAGAATPPPRLLAFHGVVASRQAESAASRYTDDGGYGENGREGGNGDDYYDGGIGEEDAGDAGHDESNGAETPMAATTPVAAVRRQQHFSAAAAARPGAGLEPPSPPIHLLPAHQVMAGGHGRGEGAGATGAASRGRHTEASSSHGGGFGAGGGVGGANRRRSVSPEPGRASANAAALQQARRMGPAAAAAAGPAVPDRVMPHGRAAQGAGGGTGGGRANSPAAGPVANTWLP